MHRSSASSKGMQTLAHALKQVSGDSNLGKMVSIAVKKTKVVRKNRTRIKVDISPASKFHNEIRKTAYLGVGSLKPCSLLAWRPGHPVLSDGKTGRIKWGLSDGKNDYVVMVFDTPIPIYGTDSTTEYGFVHTSTLSPCDCAGYLHGRHCATPRLR